MKKILSILLLLCSAGVFGAAWESLKISSAWEQRARSADAKIAVEDGKCTLSGDALLLSPAFKAKPGTRLRFHVVVSGTGKFLAYAESFGPAQKIAHSTWAGFFASAEPQNFKTQMGVPKWWQAPVRIILRSTPGAKITFSNLKIEELPLPEFSQLGLNWEVRGETEVKTFYGTKIPALQIPNFGNRAGAVLEKIPVVPGKNYEIECRVMGAPGVRPGTPTGFHLYKVDFRCNGKKPHVINTPYREVVSQNVTLRKIRLNVPEDNTVSSVDLEVSAAPSCSVFFSVEKIAELEKKLGDDYYFTLISPASRGMIFSTLPVKEISGKCFAPGAMQCRITLCDKSEKVCYQQKLSAPEKNFFSFRFPAEKIVTFEPYRITAELSGKDGKIIRSFTERIQRISAGKNEVTFAPETLKMHIQGKPVFLNTVWGSTMEEADLRYFAENGINAVKSGADRAAAWDRANRLGLKVFSGLFSPRSGDKAVLTKQLKKVLTPQIINHPALAGYFMTDEPEWNGISADSVGHVYKELCKLDPYHPAWINAAPPSTADVLNQYARHCDMFGVDIYPVPQAQQSVIDDKSVAIVGKQVVYTRNAVNNAKPVDIVLQAFAWGDLYERAAVYPTPEQLRFMVADSILKGANSISWWGIYSLPSKVTPAYRKFHYDLAGIWRQIAQVGFFIANGNAQFRKAGVVEIAEFSDHGKTCFVIANATAKPVSVKADVIFKSSMPKYVLNDRGNPVEFNGKEIKLGAYQAGFYFNVLPPRRFTESGTPDPFPEKIRKQNENCYTGRANWIWAEGSLGKPFSKALIGRMIEIRKPLQSATFLGSADDYGDLYLNGKKIGSISTWNVLKKYDLTAALKQGKNLLLMSCAEAGVSPHAAIADITLKYKDGSVERILTDGSWKAVEKGSLELTPEEFSKWQPAKVISPYGQGVRKRIKMPTAK